MISAETDRMSLASSPITSRISRVTRPQGTCTGAKHDVLIPTDHDFAFNEKLQMVDFQQHKPSKFSFFRRLSTRFRSSAPLTVRLPAPPSPHRAPLPSPFIAKGNREAALRERGLLPPKDLSEQERDLDQATRPAATNSCKDDDVETAAKRIKAEWEANNRRTRNPNQFISLGPSSSESAVASGSFEAEVELALALQSLPKEPTTNGPYEFNSPQASSKELIPPPSPPHLSPTTSHRSRTPSPARSLPPSPSPNINELEPWSIGLPLSAPPSPLLSASQNAHAPHSPSRSRAKSAPPLPSLSESASLAPSSIATPLTPVDASGPSDPAGAHKQERDPAKPTLGIKVRDYVHDIPMIVESPVDDTTTASLHASKPFIDLRSGQASPTPRPRLCTDPGQAAHRRSFLGLSRLASKRSTSSLANFRSVVGSLRRPSKASPRPLSHFDASHLPPSPTLPAPFASQPASPLERRPRQPLSPTIHSRGSILLSMGDIEDEESRRLSELAFLD